MVIASMVRSNDEGDMGFCGESRRINVLVSRAKRHFYLVGDKKTLTKHPLLARLHTYINRLPATEGQVIKPSVW